uniref:Putative secreted protein n=1 Tax=Amblyomma americanum TaxID=6943 RepID=A0A0C9SEL1_AMBAM
MHTEPVLCYCALFAFLVALTVLCAKTVRTYHMCRGEFIWNRFIYCVVFAECCSPLQQGLNSVIFRLRDWVDYPLVQCTYSVYMPSQICLLPGGCAAVVP